MNHKLSNQILSPQESADVIAVLKARFEKFSNRHQNISWSDVVSKLEANATKLWSLSEMEKSGGEPDVIGIDQKTQEYIFCDCSPESPVGRRSLCYDKDSLDSRKEHKPRSSALETANNMGIEVLTEAEYRQLQQLGNFDTKTSSWLTTPPEIRNLGGAIFGDYRYAHVFVYHNGAESYYSSRGFRGLLKV